MVLLGIYTAIALAVFAIEAQLPPIVPVPGIKLGLANITTLLLISEYA
ncbi:MAG TPA: Gx transporter family protein, partial [Oscillospiraceae bacterium]|nr:Gx transporter family protein [Oscillospiraceae bacterium]